MKVRKIISCLLLTVCCTLFGSSVIIYASEATGEADTTSVEDVADVGNTADAQSSEEAAWPVGPEIVAESAIVMDVDSGTVLYSKDCRQELYPASITKILTALLAIENSEMDELVTFSHDSVYKTEGSSIWRDVDEIMTMEQCLYALMLNSANECAYAIAEHVGGTYENFVQMMNERARALGCKNTDFNNPHGLPDEDHYSCSYDMALIASEAIKNDVFREIAGTRRYDIPPTNKHEDEITYLRNHHRMLFEGEEYYYEYCIGGKTGYTESAGNTLVTYAEKDGMTLVCVVMKDQQPAHYEDTIALLDYSFESFRSHNIADNLKESGSNAAGETGFLSQPAFADIDKTATIVLPVDVEFAAADMEIVYDEAKSDTAGTLQYSYAGQAVGSVDVKRLGTPVKEYPFEERKEQQPKEEGTKKVVQINVWAIVLAFLGVVAVAAAAFGVYILKENFYQIRYKLYSNRKRDMREIVIKKKRRRRRR